MHLSARRACRTLALALACGAGFGSGCASLDASKGAMGDNGYLGDGGNGNLGVLDSGRKDGQVEADATVALNPLCGAVRLCGGGAPDDPAACADYDAGGPPPDAGRDGSAGGAPSADGGDAGDAADAADAAGPSSDAATDAARDASADAASPGDAASHDGAVPEGGAGPADTGAGGTSSDVSAPPPALPPAAGGASPAALPSSPVPVPTAAESAGPAFACQVGSDDYGNAFHRCGRAGQGDTEAPCASSGECRAGLACVGAVGVGQCLPYCCHPGTVCSGGEDGGRRTFCADRPLLEGGRREKTLQVPVCAPAEECRLLDDPYPCTGSGCACGSDMACAVVSEDGTTSCVTPGTGKVGEPCPCAAGYYCSKAENKCTKLCKTAATDSGCAPGRCAAAGGLPPGFGLCLGAAPLVK